MSELKFTYIENNDKLSKAVYLSDQFYGTGNHEPVVKMFVNQDEKEFTLYAWCLPIRGEPYETFLTKSPDKELMIKCADLACQKKISNKLAFESENILKEAKAIRYDDLIQSLSIDD
jgi:hypothetical protein